MKLSKAFERNKTNRIQLKSCIGIETNKTNATATKLYSHIYKMCSSYTEPYFRCVCLCVNFTKDADTMETEQERIKRRRNINKPTTIISTEVPVVAVMGRENGKARIKSKYRKMLSILR